MFQGLFLIYVKNRTIYGTHLKTIQTLFEKMLPPSTDWAQTPCTSGMRRTAEGGLLSLCCHQPFTRLGFFRPKSAQRFAKNAHRLRENAERFSTGELSVMLCGVCIVMYGVCMME